MQRSELGKRYQGTFVYFGSSEKYSNIRKTSVRFGFNTGVDRQVAPYEATDDGLRIARRSVP